MNKKYIVRLTAEERNELENLVKKGKTQVYRIKHVNTLLAVDADGPNLSDENSAQVFGCHQNTVRNVRQRFVEQGIEAALERKKRDKPPRELKIDGEKEAKLIAIACSEPMFVSLRRLLIGRMRSKNCSLIKLFLSKQGFFSLTQSSL